MSSIIRLGCCLAWLGIAFSNLSSSQAEEPADSLRVMSFNVRYGTASDGENHWDRRKEFLVKTIETFHPDLLGTQETLCFQKDYIAEKLPEYNHLGVGRDDGKLGGEMMALYYRRDRFESLEEGHFWLSETPDQIGSKSWDSSLPRMVTWVKLRDRKRTDGSTLLFLNTHFDHKGPTARLESARLIRKKIAELGKNGSIVLTGDFNTSEASPPYKALFDKEGDTESRLVDSYRVTHPEKGPNEGTFSGFKADQTVGARIDWIGVSRDWKVVASEIDRTSKEGRTPSDHYPVIAVLMP